MMELLLRVLKWSLTVGAVTALVALTKPLLDKRFTPRWRYWLWLVLAMALLLAPVSPGDLLPALPEPAVTVTAPEVRVPVPDRDRPAPVTPVTPATPNDPATPGVTPEEPVTPNVTPGDPVAPNEPVTPVRPAASGTSATPEAAGTAEGRTVELSALLTAVWLLGAAVFALWHAAGTALLALRLRRWSVPAGGGTVARCRELSRELGLRRTPEVGVSRGLASPLVAGLFRPRLWLPDRAWEERELTFILRHELTHIKRRDLWYKALMLLANALHWFDPLIWLMRREAGETAELLCDAQALRGADRETRRAYCETLLEHVCRVPGAALTTHFYGGKRSVKTRFQNLLSGRKRRFGWAALACCVLAVAVTACAVGVGASTAIAPEEFDGKYTANCFQDVSIRDKNGRRIQNEAVLVDSLDELDKLRRDNGIEPLDEGGKAVNGELVERLDTYTKDYFRENILVVLIREMGAGSFDLSVEGVTLDGDALKVSLAAHGPTAPTQTMELCQWCVLVECKRVEGVAAAKWSFSAQSGPEPDSAPLAERVGDELLDSASGAVLKVNWRGDVTNLVLTEEYRVRDLRDALAGLDPFPSDLTALPEDELTILVETGDGLYGARLGMSDGPLELIWDGVSTFCELSDSQREALWRELYHAAQNALADGLFAGITVDGSLTMEEAAAAISERMAENVRALPDWVEWKPLDARFNGGGRVFDAYLGEPEYFCAGVGFALKLPSDDPEDPCRSCWETGSGLPDEPISGGELDGYYEWGVGANIARNADGQWELLGLGTGGLTVEMPDWTFSWDGDDSLQNAPLEELMRVYTLTLGDSHRYLAEFLLHRSPEELADLPAALTALSVDQARELRDIVAQFVSEYTAPAGALLLEALEAYTGN